MLPAASIVSVVDIEIYVFLANGSLYIIHRLESLTQEGIAPLLIHHIKCQSPEMLPFEHPLNPETLVHAKQQPEECSTLCRCECVAAWKLGDSRVLRVRGSWAVIMRTTEWQPIGLTCLAVLNNVEVKRRKERRKRSTARRVDSSPPQQVR